MSETKTVAQKATPPARGVKEKPRGQTFDQMVEYLKKHTNCHDDLSEAELSLLREAYDMGYTPIYEFSHGRGYAVMMENFTILEELVREHRPDASLQILSELIQWTPETIYDDSPVALVVGRRFVACNPFADKSESNFYCGARGKAAKRQPEIPSPSVDSTVNVDLLSAYEFLIGYRAGEYEKPPVLVAPGGVTKVDADRPEPAPAAETAPAPARETKPAAKEKKAKPAPKKEKAAPAQKVEPKSDEGPATLKSLLTLAPPHARPGQSTAENNPGRRRDDPAQVVKDQRA